MDHGVPNTNTVRQVEKEKAAESANIKDEKLAIAAAESAAITKKVSDDFVFKPKRKEGSIYKHVFAPVEERIPSRAKSAKKTVQEARKKINKKFDQSLSDCIDKKNDSDQTIGLVTPLTENGAVKRSDLWGRVSYENLNKDEKLLLVSKWVEDSNDFIDDLVQLAAKFKKAANLPELPTLESFTPQQMQTWREVSAAMARAYRAQLTPEQAAKESQDGTKRSKASRAQMSPEKRAQRSAKEAKRLRIKRALANHPQP